ncbi:MAG: GGDEF domain-containing protein [Gammaproteobacteria bacterium]|nr:GGDEF domain-containing protein [Gammaproteobacteria bacterium]
MNDTQSLSSEDAKLPKHLIDALPRVQLFRDVDQALILPLLQQCNCCELDEGEILISPSQENKHLFIVLSGNLIVHLDGHENQALTCLDPGECVGELSAIDEKLPSAIVKATKKTSLLAIDNDVLLQMTHVSHQIALNLIFILVGNVRFCNQIIANSFEMQSSCLHYATIDALTGLHNRGWMDEMFDREVNRSIMSQQETSIIMIDIDYFKEYNDENGHQAGDQVLRAIGEMLRKPLRPNDMIARYGGEEFMILLPNTTSNSAMSIAERLRKQIEKMDIGKLNDRTLPCITISLGVASNLAIHDLHSIVGQADFALYRAKQQGRNNVASHV